MYETQTEEMILQRMLSNASSGVNAGEGDFFYDAVSPAAMELAIAYQNMEQLLEVGFAKTSFGEYLDRITAERGVYRKPATRGEGLIEVNMAVGSQITTGDVLATWEGNVRFNAAADVIVGETGKALVEFENETAGNLGNVLANTQFVAPVAIPGFISAVNPVQINAGTEEESDELLKSRYFSVVQTPATSGNKYHYLNWAKEVAGVGDARVFPPADGSRVVKLVVIDSNRQPAAPSLVEAVQEYIDPGATGLGDGQAPIGAVCNVIAAEGVEVHVSATVTGADPVLVKPIFETDLANYLKSIAFVKDTVSYAQVGSILLDSVQKAGGSDYTGLKLNNGSVNVQIGEEAVAIMGMVTLT